MLLHEPRRKEPTRSAAAGLERGGRARVTAPRPASTRRTAAYDAASSARDRRVRRWAERSGAGWRCDRRKRNRGCFIRAKEAVGCFGCFSCFFRSNGV